MQSFIFLYLSLIKGGCVLNQLDKLVAELLGLCKRDELNVIQLMLQIIHHVGPDVTDFEFLNLYFCLGVGDRLIIIGTLIKGTFLP